MQYLARDGVKLGFEEAGSGDPAILLVHGWTCDHTYMAPQFTHLCRTHRVIAVDLRGHGQSDKPQQDYTMLAFADDLVWLCNQLKVKKPVVIGHSMGGVIAVELAARFPEVPGAVVTLDSPIVPPQELLDGIAAPTIAALRGPDFREVQRKLVAEALFLPTDDPVRKARIIADMSSAPQHVMASAFAGIFCDTAASAAACKVPLLILMAAQPLSDVIRLRQASPNAVIGQTVGAGHFHQLEVPEQVNAMIDRFLAVSVS
ncbi:MAG: alpha/beta hydrolase [Deltaproteobacteria bacterium]|nr:alpha/beta hydrolase [Deltaproteobacteria bacterium]